MTQIKLDASIANELRSLEQTVELCDPAGQVLGQFLPLIDMSQWEPISPDISQEELDRRANSDDWCTTEDVLAHLKGLENK